jgi:hypothetical protein
MLASSRSSRNKPMATRSLKAKQLVGVGRKTRVYWFRAMSRKWREGPTIAALPLARASSD